MFKVNHTMRFQPEYGELVKELFGGNIGLKELYLKTYLFTWYNHYA